jgi:hypothetical protein
VPATPAPSRRGLPALKPSSVETAITLSKVIASPAFASSFSMYYHVSGLYFVLLAAGLDDRVHQKSTSLSFQNSLRKADFKKSLKPYCMRLKKFYHSLCNFVNY